ncbi:MAG: damage-inducible protein DinB [Chloroflexota bacterium]|nr:MAG: damage-inducible protein DinB [Chloroflexota bacterium]
MDRELLVVLYSYNAYANRLVLETAARLSDEEFTRPASPSHESVQMLLLHIIRAETFFLKQSQGQSLPPQPAEAPTLAQIRAYTDQLAQEQEAFVRSLAENDLTLEVEYEMGGHPFRLAVWQMLTQAFVHSTHHRGELSIVVSELGHPLPTLDIIIPFVTQSGQEWPG